MFSWLKQIFRLQFIAVIVAIIAGIYYPQIVHRIKSTILSHSVIFGDSNESESITLHYNVPEQQQQEQTDKEYTAAPAKDHEQLAEAATKLFTAEDLAKYNGEHGMPLYLALLGSVYDVSRGIKHYGPGCSYNFFVGRDASVSFISGEFENYDADKADDVLQLKPTDLLSLANWKSFYDKDYVYKGKLIGRFYDQHGEPTKYQQKYLAVLEQAKETKANENQLRILYPDCNIEWSEAKGTRVSCTTTSGGSHQRDWIGHPRKLYDSVKKKSFRCACIREEDLDIKSSVRIEAYDNCPRLDHECYYRV